MSGFVIDTVLAFLFKSTVRLVHFLKSSKWDRRTALVTDRAVLDPFMGCPSVKMHYEAASNGRSTEGWDEIPFFFDWSAKQYAQKFSDNLPVRIRVNPKNSQEMWFFELDQKGLLAGG